MCWTRQRAERPAQYAVTLTRWKNSNWIDTLAEACFAAGGRGFQPGSEDANSEGDRKLETVTVNAVRRKCSPEFMNRIDGMCAFRALGAAEIDAILDIELRRVAERIQTLASNLAFSFKCTTAARAFLLKEGTDTRHGARHLKRAIEQHLMFSFANLLASGQIQLGDFVVVDHDAGGGQLRFERQAQTALARVAAA